VKNKIKGIKQEKKQGKREGQKKSGKEINK